MKAIWQHLSKLQMHTAFKAVVLLLGVYFTDKLACAPDEYLLVSHCSALVTHIRYSSDRTH